MTKRDHFSLPGLRAVALAALLAVVAPTGTSQAAPQDGQQFGDWKVRCEQNPNNPQVPNCFIFQSVVENQSNQTILAFLVALSPDAQEARAIFIAPLGVDLRAGLQLQVDDGTPTSHGFTMCLRDGCQAHVRLDDVMLDRFKRGLKGTISYLALPNGRNMRLPISFKGFTAALNSLK